MAGKVYDTKEILRAASQASVASEGMGEAAGEVRKLLEELPECFQGSSATELENQLCSLESDLDSISSGLAAITKTLQRFARLIEEADRAAAIAINGVVSGK